MKKKTIFILIMAILIIGIIIFFLFFHTKTAKNPKIGNNSTSQEIVEYVLNISSYEATVKVEVESNKNNNQYILKQEYKPDRMSQEVIEPTNIAGVKIIKTGNQLKIENTNLSLTSIFENYEYVSDNALDLSCFIKDYQSDEKASWKEENNQIIMSTKKEQEEKTLWIDRTNGKPKKIEIKWTNKNEKIYILYNEVNLNSLK